MKTKVILFLALAAVITLSFTFSASPKVEKKVEKKTESVANTETTEPVGGFVSEDKF